MIWFQINLKKWNRFILTMHPLIKIELPIPFPLRSVNCYFSYGPLPTLFDAGINTPQARRILHEELVRLGSGIAQIRRIVITHGHLDHAGMAGWIAYHSKGDILINHLDFPKITLAHTEHPLGMQSRYADFLRRAGVPEITAARIIKRLMTRRKAYIYPMTKATFIKDSDEFRFNGLKFRVLATPGHTPGALSLYLPEEKILLSGDTLLRYITPNPVVELDNPNLNGSFPSLKRYLESLDRLKRLSIKIVLPGHGEPFCNPEERVDQIKIHIQRRQQQVIKVLKKLESPRGVPLVQIAAHLFPMLHKRQIFLTLSESIAHLDLLIEKGCVTSYSENHLDFYRLC